MGERKIGSEEARGMNDPDFEKFWATYPRKEAKKDALKAWGALCAEQKYAALAAIPLHIKAWNVAGRSRQYIPLPATWIRGERWEDELGMPEPKAVGEWWRSPAGIEAKAREVGCWPARPSEGWHELKARILAKERAA